MLKLIHTSEGKLIEDNPLFTPGTKVRLPVGWRSEFGYINEKTIKQTHRLRELPGWSKSVYFALSPNSDPYGHAREGNFTEVIT